MKFAKTLPLALLSTLLLAGCGEQENRPTTLKELYDAFEDGEIDGQKVDSYIFGGQNGEALLSSKDGQYNKVDKTHGIYYPIWMWAEGLDDEDYEERVFKGTESQSFQRYENDVIVASEETSMRTFNKDYDPQDEDDDGLTKDPTKNFSGVATINKTEDGKIGYHYVRDDKLRPDMTNYNFYQETENSEETVEKVFSGAAMGSEAYLIATDAFSQFSQYSTQWDDLTALESYKASKGDGKLKYQYAGDLCMDLYSAERLWAWEYADDDEDYEEPINKTTEEYNGIYVDRRIRFSVELEIDSEGFLTYIKATYFSYWTRLLRDPNYTAADDLPGYPLVNDDFTEDDLAALKARLYEPKTIPTSDGKSEQNNPYYGGYVTSNLPYEYDEFKLSGASLGNFDESKLPSHDGMRDNDGTDEGVWINALELLEEEF